MQLNSFLNNVAYLYLIDQEFQKISDLAGIEWSKLPDFDCVRIVKKYLNLRANNPHRTSLSECSGDVGYLEKCKLDLQSIGGDEEEIGIKFQKYFKSHRFQELGEKLVAFPDQGEQLLRDFDVNTSSAVKTKTVTEFLPTEFETFLEKQKLGQERVVIPGFEMTSRMIGGFNPGRVIMILGETGFGKTNFAINLMVRASTRSKCLFVNMEMPLADITNRLVVLTTNKSFKSLYEGGIKHEEAVFDLKAYGDNLKFTEGYSLGVQTIESLMRKEKQSGLDFVVIDYDQKIDLVYSKNIPEWKLLQIAIQKLEDVAKELNVCVILLTQVNRDGQVSSSHRSTFTAHTILNFKSNDAASALDHQANALVSAEKNRHGKKDQACLLKYNSENLNITEVGVVDYKKLDPGVKREKSF
jgi:RecA/RadA recombinase